MWIGAYEFLHAADVPWRVVLNECIELAKEFGGTDGHKYVNGVLNGLAPKLRAVEVGSRPRHRQGALMKIARRAERIEPFYVMEVAKAAPPARARIRRQRQPDDLPEHRRAGLHRAAAGAGSGRTAIRDGRTQYTHATGLDRLRERISHWYTQRFGVDVPARRIVVTAGASGGPAACLPGADRGRRRDPDAGPQLPLQPALRERGRGRCGADPHPPPKSATS
jgi:hypothetical protein